MTIGHRGLVAIAVSTLFIFAAGMCGAGPAAETDAAPKVHVAPTRADVAPKADVATLLFEQPMWRHARPGSVLRYAFSRSMRRKSFSDDILIELREGDDAESRDVEVKMFSGSSATAAGPFYSIKVNPVLVLLLEQNVQELSRLTGYRSSDLKDAIRKAWRDDVKIFDTSLDVRGRRVPGMRITIAPFSGEPFKGRMKGLDRLVYTVEIADGVPGRIAGIDIRTPANEAAAFRETLRYSDGRIR